MCVGHGKPRPVETMPDASRFDSGRRRIGPGFGAVLPPAGDKSWRDQDGATNDRPKRMMR